MIPPTRFMHGAHRTREQARGNQQNEQAGETKEMLEVETQTAAIKSPASNHRAGYAKQSADGRRTALALLKYSQQEKDRLQPLTGNGKKHHGNQRIGVAVATGESTIQSAGQLLAQTFGCAAHPEHHPGQHRYRDQTHHRLKHFLLALRELGADKLQSGAHKQGQACSKENTYPDSRHPGATAGLAQITGNNANNQRRFKAFAQHDQKGNKHESQPCQKRESDTE